MTPSYQRARLLLPHGSRVLCPLHAQVPAGAANVALGLSQQNTDPRRRQAWDSEGDVGSGRGHREKREPTKPPGQCPDPPGAGKGFRPHQGRKLRHQSPRGRRRASWGHPDWVRGSPGSTPHGFPDLHMHVLRLQLHLSAQESGAAAGPSRRGSLTISAPHARVLSPRTASQTCARAGARVAQPPHQSFSPGGLRVTGPEGPGCWATWGKGRLPLRASCGADSPVLSSELGT